jgi:hypothetical protein
MVMLSITENKGYKNINLKEQAKVPIEVNGKQKEVMVFVLDGESVVVEKNFKDGKAVVSSKYKNPDGTPSTSYACMVKYEGEDVSFFLNARQHDAYKVLGDKGSKIKITGTLVTEPREYLNLGFELVK